MSDDAAPPDKPASVPRGEAQRVARAEREAAALRANLRRRKEQSRARQAEAPDKTNNPGTDAPQS
jgi:uncharacterized protein (DUF2252 family)